MSDRGHSGKWEILGVSKDAPGGTGENEGWMRCQLCGMWYSPMKMHLCPKMTSGTTAPTDGIVWIKYEPLPGPHEPGIIEQLSAQIESLQAKIAELDLELCGMSEGYTQRGYEVESLREEVEELKEKWFDNVQRANAANELARELAKEVLDEARCNTQYFASYGDSYSDMPGGKKVFDLLDKARAAGLLEGK